MTGYVSISGAWIFNLSLGLDEYSVDLQFESVTTGWKAKILDMWQWGVILPKATRLSKTNGNRQMETGTEKLRGFRNGPVQKLTAIWTESRSSLILGTDSPIYLIFHQLPAFYIPSRRALPFRRESRNNMENKP
jgi:hypothetical protein